MKIAILFDRFGPYHIARIKGAMEHAEMLAVEGAPHRAVYDWVPPELPEGLAYAALTKVSGEETDAALIERRLDELVAPFKPDVLALAGWSNMITLTALRWCARKGIPAVCMTETNDWDFERKWLAERVKKGIVAHYSAGLATNDSQVNYLAGLGVRRDAIFRGYNAIDNAFFRAEAEKWRSQPGLPPEIAGAVPDGARGQYFLASNRFIPKKNLARLLDACAAFRSERSDDPADWPLVLLGDGDLRGEIEAQIKALDLSAHVHLPGFLQVDALPRYYATAGAFVHASTTEQWGLVVNEAMASRLPVAVSDRCGSTHFLIEDGVTGYSFDPFKTDEITRALNELAALPADTPLLDAADAKVDEVSPAKFGAGLANAAQAAVASPAKPGAIDRFVLELAIARAARNERA
ncbi:glycosyltransferase family 4 protein [Erythrobacter sp. F6033]|uniref:glycosyltransferase family 4 protein n=1 Tax=Erythrobacter sp. F6033 TaxID=2926401 RepID=UPI001FF60B07|nr:glycosyltransferase family 4 protein [Erythrobacter sp. F6033]MCK0129806.1 glycosyltransferase family 4 protein [Erythrobacter sp. F6033]